MARWVVTDVARVLGCLLMGGHLWESTPTTDADREFGGAQYSTCRVCRRCGWWSPEPMEGRK